MTTVTQMAVPKGNDGNKTVAANVRAELGYAGMSQAVLAVELGLTEMALSRRLNSRNEFSASEIAAMAEFFEIDPGELFKKRQRRGGSDGTYVFGSKRRYLRVRPTGLEPMTSTV